MNIPLTRSVIDFLDAHELTTLGAEDPDYLDSLLINMEEMMGFEGGEEWRSEMVKEYQEYFFRGKSWKLSQK